jgi:hypothetical protein
MKFILNFGKEGKKESNKSPHTAVLVGNNAQKHCSQTAI